MSKKIVERLNGRFLFVDVDKKEVQNENENLTTTEGGIIIEKKAQSSATIPYVLATVVVVGDDLSDKYKEGSRVMLIPEYRGEPLPYKKFQGVRIPEGAVIALLEW
jgi:co-chaperonin GroES (HSP10)